MKQFYAIYRLEFIINADNEEEARDKLWNRVQKRGLFSTDDNKDGHFICSSIHQISELHK